MSIRADLSASVGHAPLIRLCHASEITGCEVLAKVELLDPGGSISDHTRPGMLRSIPGVHQSIPCC